MHIICLFLVAGSGNIYYVTTTVIVLVVNPYIYTFTGQDTSLYNRGWDPSELRDETILLN